MSLFDEASLVVTPNGVKEGKLYSIKPTDGSGDLDVVRATTATRVNSDGLIEVVPRNLVTYSEQFDNASWLKLESTISANNTIAPNGLLTADKFIPNNTNSDKIIRAGSIITTGVTYTFSCYAKKGGYDFFLMRRIGSVIDTYFNLSNGTIGNVGSGVVAKIENVGNDWYRCIVTFTPSLGTVVDLAVAQTNGINSFVGDGTSGVYIWGAQLEQGSVATSYFPTTDRLNIPRLDYTNGSCPSILVEPQRTNLALRSEEFDNVYWSSGMIRNANETISPSGTMTADLVQVSGGAGVISRGITITNSAHSFSVYAKKGNWDIFRIINGSSASNVAWFNLTNGTTSNVIGGTSEIINVGNGWYRCIYNTTTPNTNAGISFALSSAMGSGAPPSDGSNIYLWGAQLEVGSYATSYIPTVGSAVTRNADVISKEGIYTNNFITSSGGTWFVDLKDWKIGDSNVASISLADTSISTYNTINIIKGTLRTRISSAVGNSYSTLPNRAKIVIKWDGTFINYFVNGVKVLTDGSFNVTNMNFLNIGSNNAIRYIDSIVLFQTPLTDQECINLTTI